MDNKALNQITAADLQELVAEKRSESRRLDYKRDLELAKDEHKRELAKDVAAFANAGGGDLIYGIEEEKDANGKNTGIPKEVVGTVCDNFDLTMQRMQHIIRDNIDPRVQGISFHKVDGFANGPVIILRIPRSWTAPHMVTSNASPFWTRNNAGRQELDVHEIRAAFVAGTEMATRVRRFRDDRLGKIIAGETPIPLREQGDAKVVLHVVPLAREPLSMDLHKLEADPNLFTPPTSLGSFRQRFNLDGLVVHVGGSDLAQRAYSQAFRDGAIEGVTCDHRYPGKPPNPPELHVYALESHVVKALENYFRAFAVHGFDGPVSVMLSVLGVRGCRISIESTWRPAWEESIVAIDRDVLVLPDVLVEQLNGADPRNFMRPVFDALWQSGGYKRSLGYGDDGQWKPDKHQH